VKLSRLLIATQLAPTGDSGVQSHFNAIFRYALSEGINTSILSPNRSGNIVLRKLGSLVTRLLIAVKREWGVLWFRRLDRELLRMQLKKELRKVDQKERVVIYAQDPGSAQAALAVRATLLRVRVVMVVHYNISEAFEQTLTGNTTERGRLHAQLLRLERDVLPRVDALIFPSRFMRDQVRERVPATVAVESHVIPNFADAVSETGDGTLDGDIISIGTLEPRKNQGFLIRVLAEANRRGYRYTLSLVGRGPSLEELKALARRLGVDAHVRFLGRVDGAINLISRYRVYAHAALMENLPITLLEAMSVRRPIIAPPVGGIPEIFTDGQEGLYWDLSNPQSASKRLISLLEDTELYTRLAKAGGERFESVFSPSVLEPIWLNAIMHIDPVGFASNQPAQLQVGIDAGKQSWIH